MTALLQKLMDELGQRGLSPHTKANYVGAVNGLARHHRRSPDQLSDEELRQYLLYVNRAAALAQHDHRGGQHVSLLLPARAGAFDRPPGIRSSINAE